MADEKFVVLHKLTVTMMRDGQVNVNGPLQDRMLCYGLLEIAKEIIAENGRKQVAVHSNGKLIQPVVVPPPDLKP